MSFGAVLPGPLGVMAAMADAVRASQQTGLGFSLARFQMLWTVLLL